MKRNLISVAVIIAGYSVIVFVVTPVDEIAVRHFYGLIGVVGYYMVKIILNYRSAQKIKSGVKK